MTKTKLSELKVGEWIPTEPNEFTIRLEDEGGESVYYSTKNQDTIVILERLLTNKVEMLDIVGELRRRNAVFFIQSASGEQLWCSDGINPIKARIEDD